MRLLMSLYQFAWQLEANGQQRLSWGDAAEARIARLRSEAQARDQLQAMLEANPSGSLGSAKLNDEQALFDAGLL